MCCYSDPKMKREVLDGLGKRRTLRAWKLLCRDGAAKYRWRQYTYRPGINKPTRLTARYDVENPSGLHVYLAKPNTEGQLRVVEVSVHRDDIWRIGTGHTGIREAVVRKLTIRKAEWQRVFGRK